ncbi:MAG: hypothetical protein EHM86_07145 [Desulfobulbaceae bacterium]|nr:MAG: hypothetical protein EHM86_07145 [Desulfobulbaceae bacterium]
MNTISIHWTPDLAVGITEIDDQHRQLFSLLADFYTNLQKGAGRDVLAKMLEDLMTYAGQHFIAEEAYLKDHPDLAQHRQQHYSFIKQMNQFERDYLLGNISLSVDMVKYVTNWLQGHISDIDKEFFSSMQSKAE